MGNKSAWESIDLQPGTPILLHGPTGCGKTVGLESFLTHRGLSTVTIDVAHLDTHDDFARHLRDTRSTSVQALVIEDVEGILALSKWGETLVTWLRARRAHGSAPVFLTCNDLYTTPVRALRALVEAHTITAIRMGAPSDHACTRYFQKFYCATWVRRVVQDRDNDLRQIHLFLEECSRREAHRRAAGEPFLLEAELPTLGCGTAERAANVFRSLTALANGFASADEWIRDTGDPERVLYSNYASLVGSNVGRMAELADTLSAADILAPSHFADRHHATALRDEMLARSIQSHAAPSRSFPTFTLTKYPRASSSAAFDVPRALGGPPMATR